MSLEYDGCTAPAVVFDDITTIIDGDVVLYRLSLEVAAGESTVLMGPSGAGKTTLIGHLVGLREPDGGRIKVADRDIWEFSRDEWREFRKSLGAMIGGSYQVHTSTFGSLTVLGNLMYTLEVRDVPEHEREPRALERLRELDLVAEAGLTPSELPAHAVKRTALARALVTDAPLVVLDEIDLGLDLQYSDRMIDAVRGLRLRANPTILLTTHSIELAKAVADTVAVLTHGRIVACGSPEEVLRGINTAEEFTQAFDIYSSEPLPTLADAERSSNQESRREAANTGITIDPAMITLTILGITAIIVVIFIFHAKLI
jgi:ABC-type multidrug transport system ATPase subunit